jgi:ketosteroid isomerase-like protein
VDSEKLGKRVKALKDIEEIKNLHRDYIYAHNREDWNAMIDCFTDTAVLEVVKDKAVGKKEITSFFLDNVAKNVRAKGSHILIQPVITMEGDKASGQWIMEHFLNDPFGSENVSWGQGRYYCEYVKDNGRWKFSLLKFTRPWPQGSRFS